MAEDETAAVTEAQCFRCGTSENDRNLLRLRKSGEEKWVCTACLPYLIHGE